MATTLIAGVAAVREDLAQAVMGDIENFKAAHGGARAVLVWCGSTEIYHEPSAVQQSLAAFEAGLRASDPAIALSMAWPSS